MVKFPPEQLDLVRLIDNLATRKEELRTYEGIIVGLEPGAEHDAWKKEAVKKRAEIVQLEDLIHAKKEYDRGSGS